MTKKQLHALKALPMPCVRFRTFYGEVTANYLVRNGYIKMSNSNLYELTQKGKEALQ